MLAYLLPVRTGVNRIRRHLRRLTRPAPRAYGGEPACLDALQDIIGLLPVRTGVNRRYGNGVPPSVLLPVRTGVNRCTKTAVP